MKKLLVIWKSTNNTDITKFIIPFSYNSKSQKWFDDVNVLIWGGSQEIVRDETIYQEQVKTLINENIQVYACKMCADQTNSTNVLESLGVNVMYTGTYLADKLNHPEWEVLTI